MAAKNNADLASPHVDKVADSEKASAHTAFQRIAFANAILSDPARRARYDATGSTSDSLLDSDGFNWTEYYRSAFADAISADAIEKFARQYKGSDEERDDLLAAFEQHKGKMGQVYESVMLADVLEDDARFREILDEAVEKGEVTAWKAYTGESQKSKEARVKEARKERGEAEEYAKELGVHEKLFGGKGKGKGKGKKKGDDGEAGLAALIQSRQKERGDSFLDSLAAKYGATPGSSKKGKKGKQQQQVEVEPDEEAFQAAAAKLGKKKKATEEPAAKASKKSRR